MFNTLLSKELTRKEFLKYLGLLFLAVTGISGLMHTLSNPRLLDPHGRQSGFGYGAYGGRRKAS
jgi:hypothetical protein